MLHGKERELRALGASDEEMQLYLRASFQTTRELLAAIGVLADAEQAAVNAIIDRALTSIRRR